MALSVLMQKDKAHIFNRQFESVYTLEQAGDPPSKGPSPYPDIDDPFIDPNAGQEIRGVSV